MCTLCVCTQVNVSHWVRLNWPFFKMTNSMYQIIWWKPVPTVKTLVYPFVSEVIFSFLFSHRSCSFVTRWEMRNIKLTLWWWDSWNSLRRLPSRFRENYVLWGNMHLCITCENLKHQGRFQKPCFSFQEETSLNLKLVHVGQNDSCQDNYALMTASLPPYILKLFKLAGFVIKITSCSCTCKTVSQQCKQLSYFCSLSSFVFFMMPMQTFYFCWWSHLSICCTYWCIYVSQNFNKFLFLTHVYFLILTIM